MLLEVLVACLPVIVIMSAESTVASVTTTASVPARPVVPLIRLAALAYRAFTLVELPVMVATEEIDVVDPAPSLAASIATSLAASTFKFVPVIT